MGIISSVFREYSRNVEVDWPENLYTSYALSRYFRVHYDSTAFSRSDLGCLPTTICLVCDRCKT
jgi:hypothetical protein